MWDRRVSLVAQANLLASSMLGFRVKGPANIEPSLFFIFVLSFLSLGDLYEE